MLARYNELVEPRQARHIGEIIRERDALFRVRTQLALKQARAGETNRRIIRLQKFLRFLLVVAVWVPLTIGRLVTRPLISSPRRR